MKKSLTKERERYIIDNAHGDMAQLVERLVRNEEASGSNPLISTKTKHAFGGVFFVLWISARRTAALSAVRANKQKQ